MKRPARSFALALFFAIGLTALPFYRVLFFEDRALLYRDLYRHFLVGKAIWAEAVRAGEGIPYWNSFSLGGMPFWAENVNSPLHPLNSIFLLVSRESYPLAMNYYVWLHYVFLFLGGFLWCRSSRLGFWPSVLFASSLALSGVVVSAHNVTHTLCALTTAPWFFFFWTEYLRRDRRTLLFGASLALAWPIYGGDPQAAYVLVLVSAALTAFWPRLPLKEKILRYAALGLLSALAAAAQLLPTGEFILESGRGFSEMKRDEQLAFSFHPWRLVETIWPQFFGNRHGESGYWGGGFVNFQGGTPFIFSTYPGSLVLLLALVSVFLIRPRVWWRPPLVLWGSFAVGITLCFGAFSWIPTYDAFLSVVPLFGAFRYPERLLFWPFLALWMIAVVCYPRVAVQLRLRTGRRRLGMVLGGMLLVYFAAMVSFAFSWPSVPQASRESVAKAALALFAYGLVFALYARGHLPRRLLPVALLAVQVVELSHLQTALVWDQSVYIADPRRYPIVKQVHGILSREAEKFASGGARRFDSMSLSGYDLIPGQMDHTTTSTFQGYEALVSNTPGYFGIEDNAGYYALVKSEKQSFWTAMRELLNFVPDYSRLHDLTGTYFIPRRDENQQIYLERNEDALPYVFLARRLVAVDSFGASLKLLKSRDFDFRVNTVVEAPEKIVPELEGAGRVRIDKRSGREARFSLKEGNPGKHAFLVWNESYDRHWKAYVNGVKIPVYRANAWAMGVFLPANETGKAEVRFAYENPLITLGVSLTGLWALLFLAVLLRARATGRSGAGSRPPREGEARA